jgi:hypothetical protein
VVAMSRDLTTEAFPVASFKLAADHLRRPFAPGAVKFKVQAQIPKDNPSKALVVGYIDARLVTERLNKVCPHLWHDEYERLDGKVLLCRLTVDGITRQDVGEAGAIGKAAFSDAFKRAAVKFGVGVSLYALPPFFLEMKDGLEQKQRQVKGQTEKYLVIKPAGDTLLRGRYEGWLETPQGENFGVPLDHGDDPTEGSVGDLVDEPPSQLDLGESLDAPRAEQQKTEILKLYDRLREVDGRKLRKTSLDSMIAGAKTNEELELIRADVDRKLQEATS